MPGIGPSASDTWRRRWWPSRRAPRRTARRRHPHPFVVELAVVADEHDVDVALVETVDAVAPLGPDRLAHARPAAHQDPFARLDQPGGGRRADVTTSPAAGMPNAASLASTDRGRERWSCW